MHISHWTICVHGVGHPNLESKLLSKRGHRETMEPSVRSRFSPQNRRHSSRMIGYDIRHIGNDIRHIGGDIRHFSILISQCGVET